jgi:hypothetical protein
MRKWRRPANFPITGLRTFVIGRMTVLTRSEGITGARSFSVEHSSTHERCFILFLRVPFGTRASGPEFRDTPEDEAALLKVTP